MHWYKTLVPKESLNHLSTVSVKILNCISRSIATLCLETPSGSTHSSIDLAVTGTSMHSICKTYFLASGGRDLKIAPISWSLTHLRLQARSSNKATGDIAKANWDWVTKAVKIKKGTWEWLRRWMRSRRACRASWRARQPPCPWNSSLWSSPEAFWEIRALFRSDSRVLLLSFKPLLIENYRTIKWIKGAWNLILGCEIWVYCTLLCLL